MMRWVLAALVTVAIIVGGWFVNRPEPDPAPPPASAVAARTAMSEDELCLALEREAFVMARGVIRQLRRHGSAHGKWRRKEIPLGPEDQPGTVLYIWKTTLHKGKMHSKHFDELDSIMRAKGCLAEAT